MNEEIITVGEPFPRLKRAEVVFYGFVKVSFLDGYEGVADLRPLLNSISWYRFLLEPMAFQKMKLQDYGHTIFWEHDEFGRIEIPAEKIKDICEKQEQIHKLMAV